MSKEEEEDFFGITNAQEIPEYLLKPRVNGERVLKKKMSKQSPSDFFHSAFFPDISEDGIVQKESKIQNDLFTEQYFKPGNAIELNQSQLSEKIFKVFDPARPEDKLEGIKKLFQLIEPVWKYSGDELVDMMSNRVIYETDDVIAFDKPIQMAYSSSSKDQAQMDRILQNLKARVCPSVERLHLVTSLDKDISGIILFAKNAEKQQKLKELIEEDHALLRFRCLVRGIPADQKTRISIPLIKVVKARNMKLNPLHGKADKKATVYKMDTDVQLVNENRHASVSLVDSFIKRGIPHVVRSHLYYGINCPIIGDSKYVKKPQGSSTFSLDQIRLSGQAVDLLNIKHQEVRKLPLCMHLAEFHIPESRGGKFSVVMAITTKFIMKVDLDLKPSSSKYQCFSTLKGASFCAVLDHVEWSTREKFIKFVHKQLGIDKNNGIILFVGVKPLYDEYYIDIMWNTLVANALKQSLHLEKMMWNLSTLGGALSAMGDFIDEFVDRALEVSLKQRRIAEILGDPVLISRCNMYIALSLAQKKNFPVAFAIIRKEYLNGRKMNCQLLINCSQGLLEKITCMWKKNARFCKKEG